MTIPGAPTDTRIFFSLIWESSTLSRRAPWAVLSGEPGPGTSSLFAQLSFERSLQPKCWREAKGTGILVLNFPWARGSA